MNKFAVFLRGVNVGGNVNIDMGLLKKSLTGENYKNVETYLNSGNIILETEEDKKDTEKHIQQIIERQFGLATVVFIKTKEDMECIVVNNPFDAIAETNNSKRMVVMFRDTITGKETSIFKDDKEDADYYLKEDIMYIYYKAGAGRSKITNPVIKTLLKQTTSSRNWNTITKMLMKICCKT